MSNPVVKTSDSGARANIVLIDPEPVVRLAHPPFVLPLMPGSQQPRLDRVRALYPDGRGGTVEIEVILAPPGEWAGLPESADPAWDRRDLGWATLALRARF